jgi:hypothetical protein
MDKALIKKIIKWREQIGRKEAGRRLVMAGVHIDTAVMLLNGSYKSEPKRELNELIEKAMEGNAA